MNKAKTKKGKKNKANVTGDGDDDDDDGDVVYTDVVGANSSSEYIAYRS